MNGTNLLDQVLDRFDLCHIQRALSGIIIDFGNLFANSWIVKSQALSVRLRGGATKLAVVVSVILVAAATVFNAVGTPCSSQSQNK